jgi:hypothetical protein
MCSTHDATVTRTTAEYDAPSKRLKMLPQLPLDLWREIIRQRSMQNEALRVEKLDRHREQGYHAVLEELRAKSWEYRHSFPSLDCNRSHFAWWIKYDYTDYKARNPRKKTKKGVLFKKWEKYLPDFRYSNVRLLYVCADELRTGTVSNHL